MTIATPTTTSGPLPSDTREQGHNRTWWLVVNSVVAAAAVVLGVVAIIRDDRAAPPTVSASVTPAIPASASPAEAERRAAEVLPAGWPARDAMLRDASSRSAAGAPRRPVDPTAGDCLARRIPAPAC